MMKHTTPDFESFVNAITEHKWKVHGVELYADGTLTHSFGDTTEHKYPIYSATKTVLSIASGIACDEGCLDLSQNILKYMPRTYVEELPPAQKEIFGQLSLHRLLTMSVKGFPFRIPPAAESFLRTALACPLRNWQTAEFDYSNIPAYLVGVALSQAIQGDAWNFIDERILKPLGISGAGYERCPDGFFYGASGMKLSVQDLSRIGLLLYNGGTFAGQRIVSADYVKKATAVQQMNREGGYGYFIWKYKDGFSINGKWGQKCYVLPERGLMISILSDIRDSFRDLQLSMEKHLLKEA